MSSRQSHEQSKSMLCRQREHPERAWRQSMEKRRAWRQSMETERHGDSQREHGDRESGLETERIWRQRQHADREGERERACLVDRESIHTERYAMLTGRTPRHREHGAHGDRPRERANYCIQTHTHSVSLGRGTPLSVCPCILPRV